METRLNPSEGVPPAEMSVTELVALDTKIHDELGAIVAKRWPKCSVKMRDGSIVDGEIVDTRENYSTVRINTEPRDMPGGYGIQKVDYQYLDVQNKFVTPSRAVSMKDVKAAAAKAASRWTTPQPVEPAASGTPEIESHNADCPLVVWVTHGKCYPNPGCTCAITAERDAALTQTAAIQAQWDAAMGDLKTLEADRAQYREAIKVATDALEDSRADLACYEGDPKYPAKKRTLKAVRAALARISELTPKV